MRGWNAVLRHKIRKRIRWRRCADRNPCSVSSCRVGLAYSFTLSLYQTFHHAAGLADAVFSFSGSTAAGWLANNKSVPFGDGIGNSCSIPIP